MLTEYLGSSCNNIGPTPHNIDDFGGLFDGAANSTLRDVSNDISITKSVGRSDFEDITDFLH